MAGIYIHIPFCKQACHYCNFHFSTNTQTKVDLLNALHVEMEMRKDYLDGEPISTIYFGGGTPSLLSEGELHSILDNIFKLFKMEENVEVTLEANPDDINREKLKVFSSTAINRFSIGIQSFHEADLQYMNRAHNAQEALNSILLTQDAGFSNITIDLIYGTPTMSNSAWMKNLEQFASLNLSHLSAYSLTVEPNTALDHMIKKGKARPVEEERAAEQFKMLMEVAPQYGLEHYEISNFAKKGHRSRHNSSYWTGQKYLGLGPSAHSYNGIGRQWNIANNIKYIKALGEKTDYFGQEILSASERYNEYLLTHLRTAAGVNLTELEENFGAEKKELLSNQANALINQNLMAQNGSTLYLTNDGKLLADTVISDLFEVE